MSDVVTNPESPADILRRLGEDDSVYFRQSTIPLFAFHDRPSVGSFRGNGSAVAVAINERRFLFTAGHCVERIGERTLRIGVPVLAMEPIGVRPLRTGCRREGRRDFGYIELPPDVVRAMDRVGARFLSLDQLQVPMRAGTDAGRDWSVILGFPTSMVEPLPPNRHAVTPLLFVFNPGQMNLAKGLPPGRNIHEVEHLTVSMPANSFVPTARLTSTPGKIGDLGGLSGGGCWSVPGGETARREVFATYVGRGPTDADGEMLHLEMVSVAWHLALIAKYYEDLTDEITSRHPSIWDYEVW